MMVLEEGGDGPGKKTSSARKVVLPDPFVAKTMRILNTPLLTQVDESQYKRAAMMSHLRTAMMAETPSPTRREARRSVADFCRIVLGSVPDARNMYRLASQDGDRIAEYLSGPIYVCHGQGEICSLEDQAKYTRAMALMASGNSEARVQEALQLLGEAAADGHAAACQIIHGESQCPHVQASATYTSLEEWFHSPEESHDTVQQKSSDDNHASTTATSTSSPRRSSTTSSPTERPGDISYLTVPVYPSIKDIQLRLPREQYATEPLEFWKNEVFRWNWEHVPQGARSPPQAKSGETTVPSSIQTSPFRLKSDIIYDNDYLTRIGNVYNGNQSGDALEDDACSEGPPSSCGDDFDWLTSSDEDSDEDDEDNDNNDEDDESESHEYGHRGISPFGPRKWAVGAGAAVVATVANTLILDPTTQRIESVGFAARRHATMGNMATCRCPATTANAEKALESSSNATDGGQEQTPSSTDGSKEITAEQYRTGTLHCEGPCGRDVCANHAFVDVHIHGVERARQVIEQDKDTSGSTTTTVRMETGQPVTRSFAAVCLSCIVQCQPGHSRECPLCRGLSPIDGEWCYGYGYELFPKSCFYFFRQEKQHPLASHALDLRRTSAGAHWLTSDDQYAMKVAPLVALENGDMHAKLFRFGDMFGSGADVEWHWAKVSGEVMRQRLNQVMGQFYDIPVEELEWSPVPVSLTTLAGEGGSDVHEEWEKGLLAVMRDIEQGQSDSVPRAVANLTRQRQHDAWSHDAVALMQAYDVLLRRNVVPFVRQLLDPLFPHESIKALLVALGKQVKDMLKHSGGEPSPGVSKPRSTDLDYVRARICSEWTREFLMQRCRVDGIGGVTPLAVALFLGEEQLVRWFGAIKYKVENAAKGGVWDRWRVTARQNDKWTAQFHREMRDKRQTEQDERRLCTAIAVSRGFGYLVKELNQRRQLLERMEHAATRDNAPWPLHTIRTNNEDTSDLFSSPNDDDDDEEESGQDDHVRRESLPVNKPSLGKLVDVALTRDRATVKTFAHRYNAGDAARKIRKSGIKALALFRAAAWLGDTESAMMVAAHYQTKSEHVTEAAQYFQRAVECGGHARAALCLGAMYGAGTGVRQSARIAVALYRVAAMGNAAEAQLRLSVALEQGYGGIMNRKESIEWMERAAQNGLKAAIESLNSDAFRSREKEEEETRNKTRRGGDVNKS